jgi:hypothetical protein
MEEFLGLRPPLLEINLDLGMYARYLPRFLLGQGFYVQLIKHKRKERKAAKLGKYYQYNIISEHFGVQNCRQEKRKPMGLVLG